MIKTFPSLLRSEESFQSVQYNILSIIILILLYFVYFWMIFLIIPEIFIRFKNNKKDNKEINKIIINFNDKYKRLSKLSKG